MIYIPLCEDCFSTLYLVNNDLRKFATIFDWIVIPPYDVLKLFENNFEDFFKLENLKQFDHKRDIIADQPKADKYIFDKKYHISFPHHVNDLDKDYNIVYEKFKKRIDRLEKYFLKNEEITFVYKSCYRTQEQKLNFYYSVRFSKLYPKYGVKYMNEIYPKLVLLLCKRYGYTKDKINLMIL